MINRFVVPGSLSEYVERLQSLPLHSVVLLLSMAAILTSLVMVRSENTFDRLKWKGLPRSAVGTLLSGLVVVFLLQLGLILIELAGKVIPPSISFAVPAVAGSVTFMLLLRELVVRPSFRVERFTTAVAIPILVPIVPFVGSHLPVIWRVLKDWPLA